MIRLFEGLSKRGRASGAPEEISALIERPSDSNATLADIFYCFRLILGRSPNAEELAMNQWRVGQKLDDVVATYLRSREFDERNILRSRLAEEIQLAKLDGFSLYYEKNDTDVGMAASQGVYEPEIVEVFHNALKPGMTVVDIGANIGFFTMLSASRVGPGGRVVAVEPNPVNVALLEASRRANAFDNVEIHAIAANDAAGVLTLNASYSNGSVDTPSRHLDTLLRSTLVYGAPLDGLFELDRLDFVKIDVEGAEYRALTGFKETLARFRPTIVSEFSPPALRDDTEAYLGCLLDLGYRLGVVRPNGGVDDKGFDKAAVIQSWRDRGTDHIDLLATRANDGGLS